MARKHIARGESPAATDSDRDYAVGYRKTPPETRFPKGVSGNPSGRPRGSGTLATAVAKTLAERITVQEGGKVRSMSKGRALAKSLTSVSLKGNMTAARIVAQLERVAKSDESEKEKQVEENLTPHQQKTIERLLARLNPEKKGG